MNASSFVSPPQLLALARELELPSCVCEQLVQTAVPARLDACAAQCMALTAPDTAFPAWKHLEAQFSGRDPDGMQILALYLAAACRTREKYRMMCIPDEIFRDTMGCFSRFLREAKARSGRFIFDRAFWAWRHLACRLFRLGTLEFEYRAAGADEPLPSGIGPGTPVLSVHIPSDARLSDDALPGSYGQADEFFALHGPALCKSGMPRAVLCGTWLLSPALRALLSPDSGISRFGRDYNIYAADTDSESFYLWLFGGKKPLALLPRQTSLQRAVAAHLEQGGYIGSGYGIKK